MPEHRARKHHQDRVAETLREYPELNARLEERVRGQVRELERLSRLKRFFSRPVAEAIIAGGEEMLRPHRREITAVFLDLRGFTAFTDRADPKKLDDAELVRTWYSDANFARRDRAIELGSQLKANPIHIALAYVLNQPFPSVPLIGPRKIKELDDSIKALRIKLTPEQLRWLEIG